MLAVGLVVDDAIVVVEAIEAKIEEGLSPRDAALQAMDEVSGALVGIALVLSSVFIPAAFIAGIKGALYRQFALTIAFSVLISAFNALTLSPALGALLLRPRRAGARRGLLGRFFGGFERAFGSAQTGYVRGVQFLIRKVGVALVVLVGFAVLAGGLGKTLPTSFMPQEDQGFFFMNVQLPEAASMQRTNAVMRKIDEILKAEPGVHYVNAVAGYSLLSQTASPRNGLYFVQLAPYDERATRGLQADAIVASVNRKLYGWPEARVFAFLPPAIPGVGQAGGVDVFIQDRAGKTVDYLWQNTQRFMAELQKRPEIGFVATTFAPAVPQFFARVDEDRVFKLGVPIEDVYTTLQALLGGSYVNQFNRFGRVWRVFLQAEPQYRTDPADLGLFYVRNQHGDPVPLSTLVTLEKSPGPEYSTRFNEYRAIEVFAMPAPGYSSGQAMAAVAAVADRGPAARHGIRVERHELSGVDRGQRRRRLRAVAGIRLPHPRGALRELVAAVERAAQHAGRGRGCIRRALGARPRERRLCADRAPHADRPLGEERDPDRRVREGRARAGRVASRTRR